MSTKGGVALLAALCLAVGFSVGSLWIGAEGAGESYLAQLADDLGLSTEQVARIESILAEEDADLAALLDEHRLALQGPIADRREQTEEAVLAVLDDGQRIRYEELTLQQR